MTKYVIVPAGRCPKPPECGVTKPARGDRARSIIGRHRLTPFVSKLDACNHIGDKCQCKRDKPAELHFCDHFQRWALWAPKQANTGRTSNVATHKFLNPSTMPATRGYTHVVETRGPGRTIYLAGQLGMTPD